MKISLRSARPALTTGMVAAVATLLPLTGASAASAGSTATTTTAPAVVSRPKAAVVTLADGRKLMAGGCDPSHCPSLGGAVTGAVEIFDPATLRWTYASSYPSPSRYLQAVRLADGRVWPPAGNPVPSRPPSTTRPAISGPRPGR